LLAKFVLCDATYLLWQACRWKHLADPDCFYQWFYFAKQFLDLKSARQLWWFTPVTPVMCEAEKGGSWFKASLWKNVSKTLCPKKRARHCDIHLSSQHMGGGVMRIMVWGLPGAKRPYLKNNQSKKGLWVWLKCVFLARAKPWVQVLVPQEKKLGDIMLPLTHMKAFVPHITIQRKKLHAIAFFFSFLRYWSLNSEPTPWATPPALFLWRFFPRWGLVNFLPGFELRSSWSLPPV
jgi:hypothetical protein